MTQRWLYGPFIDCPRCGGTGWYPEPIPTDQPGTFRPGKEVRCPCADQRVPEPECTID